MIATAFVAGYPIVHSRSPLIHSFWMNKHDIRGQYLSLAIRNDQLPRLITDIRNGTYVGGNITIPHKVAVSKLCDHLTPQAKAIGAVNTLYMQGDQIVGHNTDGAGFMANLHQQAPRWRKKSATVILLGAGGAARAIAVALLDDHVHRLILLNRSRNKAETLAEHLRVAFPLKRIDTGSLEHFNEHAGTTDLLVNATSIGMNNTRFEHVHPQQLARHAVVADIVYTPLETPLLQQARQAGLAAVDGLGMLLHQAVPGFHKWFGKHPEVSPELRQRLLDNLAKGSSGDPYP